MAASVSIVHQTVVGDLKVTIADVTCSEKYVSEGEAVTAAAFRLNRFVVGIPAGLKDDGLGTVNLADAYFNVATSGTTAKLILRDETPAEVASEAEIKKPVVRIVALGK